MFRRFKSEKGGGDFSYRTPLLWNQRPPQVPEADSFSTFFKNREGLFEKIYVLYSFV